MTGDFMAHSGESKNSSLVQLEQRQYYRDWQHVSLGEAGDSLDCRIEEVSLCSVGDKENHTVRSSLYIVYQAERWNQVGAA